MEMKTVMIVDDSSSMRWILRNFLKELGLQGVIEASDGLQAWELMQKRDIDAVITDWNMEGLNGIELLEKIRSTSRFEDLPVIMVSVNSKRSNIMEALDKGCTDYVLKPLNWKILKSKLEKALGKEGQDTEKESSRMQGGRH